MQDIYNLPRAHRPN